MIFTEYLSLTEPLRPRDPTKGSLGNSCSERDESLLHTLYDSGL